MWLATKVFLRQVSVTRYCRVSYYYAVAVGRELSEKPVVICNQAYVLSIPW